MPRDRRPAVRGAAGFVALLLVAGCHPAESPTPAAPVSGVSVSCERGCNGEYDSCMDRFSGASGAGGLGRSPDSSSAMLSPNDVCPDQLKSCLKRCAP